MLAYVNRRHGDIDAALEHLHRAFELDPRSVSLSYAIGQTYAALRDFDRAEQWLEKLEALGPTSARTYQLRGRILASGKGDYAAAARLLGLAARDEPWMQALEWQLLVESENYDQALRRSEFDEEFWLAEHYSNYPAFLRGLTHTFAGDEAAARPELEAALAWMNEHLSEQPEHFGALKSRCLILGALGRREAAKQACERAREHRISDEFDRAFHQKNIAGGLAMAGLEEVALELVEESLQSDAGPTVRDFQVDPALRSLHDEPRWRELMMTDREAD